MHTRTRMHTHTLENKRIESDREHLLPDSTKRPFQRWHLGRGRNHVDIVLRVEGIASALASGKDLACSTIKRPVCLKSEQGTVWLEVNFILESHWAIRVLCRWVTHISIPRLYCPQSDTALRLKQRRPHHPPSSLGWVAWPWRPLSLKVQALLDSLLGAWKSERCTRKWKLQESAHGLRNAVVEQGSSGCNRKPFVLALIHVNKKVTGWQSRVRSLAFGWGWPLQTGTSRGCYKPPAACVPVSQAENELRKLLFWKSLSVCIRIT